LSERPECVIKGVVYHHYPKLGVLCDSDRHFILAYYAGRGPRPDVDEFRPLVAEALRIVRLSQLAADAGYDSESNHIFIDRGFLQSRSDAFFFSVKIRKLLAGLDNPSYHARKQVAYVRQ